MKQLVLVFVLAVAGCGGGATTTERPETATEAPTQEPAPVIDEYEGLGVITFGTIYDEDTLEIPKPRTKFTAGINEIAWSAQFSEAAGATSVTLIFAKVSKSGAETIVDSAETGVSNPEFTLLANSADLAGIADNKAGTYVLRYLRESTLLAEGTFTLVK